MNSLNPHNSPMSQAWLVTSSEDGETGHRKAESPAQGHRAGQGQHRTQNSGHHPEPVLPPRSAEVIGYFVHYESASLMTMD